MRAATATVYWERSSHQTGSAVAIHVSLCPRAQKQQNRRCYSKDPNPSLCFVRLTNALSSSQGHGVQAASCALRSGLSVLVHPSARPAASRRAVRSWRRAAQQKAYRRKTRAGALRRPVPSRAYLELPLPALSDPRPNATSQRRSGQAYRPGENTGIWPSALTHVGKRCPYTRSHATPTSVSQQSCRTYCCRALPSRRAQRGAERPHADPSGAMPATAGQPRAGAPRPPLKRAGPGGDPAADARPASPPHPVPALGLYPAGLPLLPIPLAPACSGRTAGRGDDCPSTVIRRCSCHSASVSTHPAASSNRREGWEEGRPIGRELSLPCPPAVEVAVMAGRWGLWSSRIAARNNVTLQTF